MKKIFYHHILAIALGTTMFTGCVDELKVGNGFLEKAPGVDVNIDTVFTKAEYTRNFLWSAYGQIYCTYTSGNMMNGAPIDVLSDSYQCYVGWGGPIQSYYPGSLTEDAQDTENGNYQGKFSYSTITGGLSGDSGGRVSIYETVRKCWQIIENIDRVPDMDDKEKSRLKGEAYTIMASRYFDAFRNFGGLCLVKKAYAVGEEYQQPALPPWRPWSLSTPCASAPLMSQAIYGTFLMQTSTSGLAVLRGPLHVPCAPRCGCLLPLRCSTATSLTWTTALTRLRAPMS